MSQDEPSSKRQRTCSQVDVKSHSLYWFDDGNIILQAEDVLFRVHRSVLSRHSKVFQDMFSAPQPTERHENCPVIQVSDEAIDMSTILSILYDNIKVHNFGTQLPIGVVVAMLRLGKKYGIFYLETEAISRLHHDFPSTLESWDLNILNDSYRIAHMERETLCKVISLAHEFHLWTILPAAYSHYVISQHLRRLPVDEQLPSQAWGHCVIGHSRIQVFVQNKLVDALCPPFPFPTSCLRERCDEDGWNAIRDLPLWRIADSHPFGILYSWDDDGESAENKATKDLCTKCRDELVDFTNKVREEFWEQLPSFFGILGWNDLKDG